MYCSLINFWEEKMPKSRQTTKLVEYCPLQANGFLLMHFLLWFSRAFLVFKIAGQWGHGWENLPLKCFDSKWFLKLAVDLCRNSRQIPQKYSEFSLLMNWSSSSKVEKLKPEAEKRSNPNNTKIGRHSIYKTSAEFLYIT